MLNLVWHQIDCQGYVCLQSYGGIYRERTTPASSFPSHDNEWHCMQGVHLRGRLSFVCYLTLHFYANCCFKILRHPNDIRDTRLYLLILYADCWAVAMCVAAGVVSREYRGSKRALSADQCDPVQCGSSLLWLGRLELQWNSVRSLLLCLRLHVGRNDISRTDMPPLVETRSSWHASRGSCREALSVQLLRDSEHPPAG